MSGKPSVQIGHLCHLTPRSKIHRTLQSSQNIIVNEKKDESLRAQEEYIVFWIEQGNCTHELATAMQQDTCKIKPVKILVWTQQDLRSAHPLLRNSW